jgi:hypothetical protein
MSQNFVNFEIRLFKQRYFVLNILGKVMLISKNKGDFSVLLPSSVTLRQNDSPSCRMLYRGTVSELIVGWKRLE